MSTAATIFFVLNAPGGFFYNDMSGHTFTWTKQMSSMEECQRELARTRGINSIVRFVPQAGTDVRYYICDRGCRR